MPRQRGEFSFEKNELLDHMLSLDTNNMTAHFNKFNLMSRGKDQISDFTDNLRPNYHTHLLNDDVTDAFTLEPQFNTRNSITVTDHYRQKSLQT